MVYTDAQKKSHIQEITELLYRIAQRDSRIPAVVPSDEFTPEVSLAVRAFQEANGLPVTGEINTETWEKIVSAFHSLTDAPVPLIVFPTGNFVLQQGDSGDLVGFVQMLLRLLSRRYRNLPELSPTDSYDAQTADAVRKFQQIAGLPETGILDRTTWNQLAAFVNQLRMSI